MLRVHQVKDFYLISVATEQLRGVRVQLPFAVRDDGRLPTLDDVEQGRTDESPGLASAGSAEHGNVPVEPSVRGEAHGFPVPLT